VTQEAINPKGAVGTVTSVTSTGGSITVTNGSGPVVNVEMDVLTTKGDLLTQSAAGVFARVPVGTVGKAVVAVGGLPDYNYTRRDLLARGEGLISQNFDRMTSSNTSVLISGTVYYMLVPLYAGEIVTNVLIGVDSAGTLQTLGKVALYSKTGTQLAVSADQGNAWSAATGIYSVAMGTPFTILTTDVYYCAVLSVAGAGPGLSRSANSLSSAIAAPGGVRPCASQSGQADMPGSATFTAGPNFVPWIAVS
jgi:hypothetical protein